MKIILTKDDIEALIKQTYSGVTEITFNGDDVEVTLKVNASFFATTEQPIIKTPEPTLEEKNEVAERKGLMASGGEKRNLRKF